MSNWSPPRHTTEEERDLMAQIARQRLRVRIAVAQDQCKEREKKKRKPRLRYCKMCDTETEHGCPDCRAYICSPYIHDCYEVHFGESHAVSRAEAG